MHEINELELENHFGMHELDMQRTKFNIYNDKDPFVPQQMFVNSDACHNS